MKTFDFSIRDIDSDRQRVEKFSEWLDKKSRLRTTPNVTQDDYASGWEMIKPVMKAATRDLVPELSGEPL